VVHCCGLSLCDDHEEALRIHVLDALNDLLDEMCALACRMNVLAYRMSELDDHCDLQGVMCALAYRMNVLAYRMSELDDHCDLQGVMCALAYRMNVLAYRMNALALNLCDVDALNVHCALVRDALDARCDLKQTSLHGSLALDGHPFQRRALMRSDVDCPLVRLQYPLT
jgi:hypothetical protein